MKNPGDPCGPLGLPASYTQQQLVEYGWDKEQMKFTRPKRGPWASKLHTHQWGDQPPRSRSYTRKPSHYRSYKKDVTIH